MTISIDYPNKLVLSSASITDIVAFHQQLRGFEDDADGIFYPAIHTYKAVDLGGGAIFPAIAFINGWQLKFPAAGSYAISGGNLSAAIVPVAGVYVYQTQSAAYAVTAVGGSGITASDVANAVWQHTTGAAVAARLAEAWARLGLDASHPVTQGDTQISFSDVVLALALDDAGNGTITRQ